jgi:hypothetical protein
MKTKTHYYLGITLSYIVGLLLTVPFLVIFGFIRLVACVAGLAYDTFMFTPRVVNNFIYRYYQQQLESENNSTNLN